MLREYRKVIEKIGVIVCGIIIYACFYIWYLIASAAYGRLESFDRYYAEITVFALIALLSMLLREVSAYKRTAAIFNILKEIFICYFFGALGFGLFIYIFKIEHASRLYLLGGIVFSYLATAFFYIAHFLIYRQIRARGFNYQNVLLVGNEYTLPSFIQTIESNKSLGLNIAGIMGLESLDRKDLFGHKYFGSLSSIRKVLNSEPIDYVIFTVYRQDPAAIEKAMLICQERGIEIWLKPDFMQKIMLPRVDYLEEIPIFVLALSPKNSLKLLIKRCFDITASFILLIVFALPMLAIVFLIQMTSEGLAIFRQKRIGLNGRKFIMYKFRTMRTDMQQRRFEHRLKNEMIGPVFKMKKDPRVTKIGRFLRRYSLDEFPQFFNVLAGDMSIVGPRPPLPKEVDLYKGWQRRRLSMRPGITCIWQVTGRNKITDFEEWVRLDLKYIDTWSLWLDLKIFLKTIVTVMKGTGY